MGGSRAPAVAADARKAGSANGPAIVAAEKPEKGADKVPTVAELRAVIPPHCFQHSIPRALGLVVRDGLVIATIFWLFTRVLRTPGLSDTPLAAWEWAGWAVYAFVQGTACIGWWVLAHECGHGGFSHSKKLNDTVGWVLHSFLLVPYFSWQFSHAKHHSKTNHLLDGETHVPDTRAELSKVYFDVIHDVLGDDVFAVLELMGHLFIGWPAYLLFNVTGGRRLNGKEIAKPVPISASGLVDHFRPTSDLFPEHWRVRIFLSVLGVAITGTGLAVATRYFGWKAVMVHYWGPYLFVNAWLVLYTWLQHTDPKVPHYGDEDWTWVKGALGTIDRPYGIFDWMHHYIGSTHVCHHLFSSLPCYHAVEATAAIKAYLEPKGLYNYDPTPWPIAMWRVAKTCHYVDGVNGTQFYKSLSDKSKKQ